MLGEDARAIRWHQRDFEHTGLDGGQELLRLGAEEQQQRVRRRFFERFEESVLRLGIHALGIDDDRELPAVGSGGAVNHLFQIADRAGVVAVVADGDAA